jgi:hypothetical protein
MEEFNSGNGIQTFGYLVNLMALGIGGRVAAHLRVGRLIREILLVGYTILYKPQNFRHRRSKLGWNKEKKCNNSSFVIT